jgi:Lsr2
MRKVTVTLIDDLDQAKAADETISFGLDGRDYEIDLSKAHSSQLHKMASRYIAVARKARTAVQHRGPRRTQADRERARKIRAWAVEKGLMTTQRGRIPAHVRHEYEATERAAAVPSRPSAAPERVPVSGERTARRAPARKGRVRRTSRGSQSSHEPAGSDGGHPRRLADIPGNYRSKRAAAWPTGSCSRLRGPPSCAHDHAEERRLPNTPGRAIPRRTDQSG